MIQPPPDMSSENVKSNPIASPSPSSSPVSSKAAQFEDETYLKIWELEQEHTNTRWTVSTFFFSLSFAIFGFSFQAQLDPTLALVARISGLLIYWFAYLVFTRFNKYTNLLRAYLYELEQTQRTALDIQTRVRKQMHYGKRHPLSATRLLLYFGIIYAIGIGVLIWLGI